jgi:ribosomal protein L22
MTPDKPENPQQGTPDESKVAEEAKEAKATQAAETEAQPEPKPKRTRAKKAAPEAEGQAAAETGVDKDAAEATKEKPTQSTSSTGAGKRVRAPRSQTKNPEGTAPEGTDKSAAAGADKATKKAAERVAGRKRDRRRKPEPGVLVQARARYVRTSARKARLVCDHIRGKDVTEARAILAFTPRAAAKPWLKLLESAVANAEHNHELVGEELKIAAVHADEGPTLKRFRPRAMGRATRIRKRTSHLSITLTPKEL